MPFAFPAPIYPIADVAPGRDAVALATAMVAGGARLLQLRAKDMPTGAVVALARAVKAVADRRGAALIVNDRADVVRLVDAAGVHLGQDDLPPAAARAIVGPHRLIGFSTHTLAQVDAALAAGGIDYVAFGPVYTTQSKRDPDPIQGVDALRAARARCALPLVAIGGITGGNLGAVLATGVDAVAVIGAVCQAADPERATRELLGLAHALTTRRSPPRS